jgi:NAD(P)-dependent dehydrogenase (short-subunit alcohol dehydrogenase family)
MELYGATKAALNRITAGLAGDLDGSGIRINARSPKPRSGFGNLRHSVQWS